MNESRTYQLTSFFYALAAIISSYLIYDYYQVVNGEHFKSLCNIGGAFNCETVAASGYSTFLSIPLATWGLAYYLVAFIISVIAAKSPSASKEAALFLIPTNVLSVLASAALLIISVTVIRALCIFCVSLYFINAVVFFIHLWSIRGRFCKLPTLWIESDRTRLMWFFGLGLVILAVLAGTTSNLKEKELPLDLNNFMGRYNDAPVQIVPMGTSPRIGSDRAAIKLIEFSDFECPFCARQAKEVKRILLSYGAQVQFVFKNYPLDMSCNDMMKMPMHANACLAARAALCSDKQGKFMSFHEALFANQKSLNKDGILQLAQNEGLDADSLSACIDGDEGVRLAVIDDLKLGESLGIKGTPTFFINGKKIEGLVTAGAVERLLQELHNNRDGDM